MDVVAWVLSSGWASGINGYAVVAILGLLGRFAGVDGVPPGLQRTDVLVAAVGLAAVDLVADKIPYLDSIWDAVHTAIRPTIGAVVGALIAGQDGGLSQVVAGVVGGGTALASHSVKAGLRVAVNASPEPASNVLVSSAEDVAVAAVVGLSALWPVVAAVIAGVLLLAGAIVVALLWRTIRRLRRRRAAPPLPT